TDFPSTKLPVIYYDRRFLYHRTTSDGCRYKCIFTNITQNLSQDDVAVFSERFSLEKGIFLKKRGVLLAFETGECPIFAPSLLPAHLRQIDLFITYMAKSPVPYVYSVFVRNKNPKYRFTAEETALMLSKNYVHLLPPHHKGRKKLVAWAMSNYRPRNNRIEYASAIAKFIPVDIFSRNGTQLPRNSNSFHLLSLNYKFYLAFENSNCRNYITEKVYFNAMQCVTIAL
ncbi:unnamed protein product, partial [Taenia asiatica]|uniref:Fucosyltransferase n=1 Tax=Taenia asiatica TaxID=60517 RepID=A0A0R3VY73_TAEAS